MCAQSCPTLCGPMDCNPPGSSVYGIFQARILEWMAMPSSRAFSQFRDQTHVSYVSCIGRRVVYHWQHLGSPVILSTSSKSVLMWIFVRQNFLVLVCLTRFLQYPHFQMAIWLQINSRLKVLFNTLMVLIYCFLRVLLSSFSFFPLNVICFSMKILEFFSILNFYFTEM